MILEIDNYMLKEFLVWYKDHYGMDEAKRELLAISMAGHFHIHVRQTKQLIERCNTLGYVECSRNNIVIKIEG
jgi:hypothetical protein